MQTRLLDESGQPQRTGTVRLHRGDWRGAWWRWPEQCVLITDPPYGQKYKSGFASRSGGPDTRGLATHVAGDGDTLERDTALAKPWAAAAVWGPRRLDLIPPWGEPIEVLAHDKGGIGMGNLSIPWKPSWETIAIYGRGWTGKRTDGVLRGSVVSFGSASASNGRKHPNQKSLAVCAELVGKAPQCLPIVDPFAGSGQILLAAALLGRDAYGAEIDDEHFENCRALLEANGVRVILAA